MNKRWAIAINVLLVLFSAFVVISQLTDFSSRRFGVCSIIGMAKRQQQLAQATNIVERDAVTSPIGARERHFDLIFRPDAHIFMTGMTGATNADKNGYYFYTVYYLFPRDVSISLNEPARFTKNGLEGRDATSDEELLTNGYDVKLSVPSAGDIQFKIGSMQDIHHEIQPDWFNSWHDFALAFLLPLLTALAGIWLLRWLFPTLEQLPQLEKLACSFGLGMMAVAALTLGMKLAGFPGRGLVFFLLTGGSVAELWHDRKKFPQTLFELKKIIRRPIALVAAGIVFMILFRLAGLQGLVDFDAAANWALKSKIFYFCTGQEIIHLFSNPALAYAHMDYPTLVPSLHAATYDSIGHVNEFVTKFWPTWMLLFLLLALASLIGRNRSAPPFFLLALLLLPMTLAYVQMEGATMAMLFFVTLGIVQCGIWTIEKNPARLGLGLILLFGAGTTKYEGFIFLAVVLGWIFLLPSSRPSLKLFFNFWRAGIFCLLSALPFVCLRAQIPALHFEAGWTHYALANPIATICAAPKVFLMALSRLFVTADLANWSAANGQFHWIGKWEGISSLIHYLGLGWICLLLSVAIYFALPARRKAVLWIFAVFICSVAALSLVLASFVNLTGLDEVLSQRTTERDSGRYLFPMLWAWAAMLLVIYFFTGEENSNSDKNHFQ